MNYKNIIDIKDDVKEALKKNEPVVALESTIISHGMPYPDNYNTALEVENIVRKNGSIPATIGIIDGVIKIGMNENEIMMFSKSKNIYKASRRDIPILVSKRMNASTTVAATMICASLSNIKVFATGGIGGVHREAQYTFDISADLQELSKTNVAVISSGAKSILDIKLTLEYLETMGIPVIGYNTDKFPAFYTRSSPYNVDYNINKVSEIADIMHYKWNLNIDGGILITNPINEKYSFDENLINNAINEALIEANNKNIKGKDITPYLLEKINVITKGESLKSNIALIKSNASLASEIAVSYYSFL